METGDGKTETSDSPIRRPEWDYQETSEFVSVVRQFREFVPILLSPLLSEKDKRSLRLSCGRLFISTPFTEGLSLGLYLSSMIRYKDQERPEWKHMKVLTLIGLAEFERLSVETRTDILRHIERLYVNHKNGFNGCKVDKTLCRHRSSWESVFGSHITKACNIKVIKFEYGIFVDSCVLPYLPPKLEELTIHLEEIEPQKLWSVHEIELGQIVSARDGGTLETLAVSIPPQYSSPRYRGLKTFDIPIGSPIKALVIISDNVQLPFHIPKSISSLSLTYETDEGYILTSLDPSSHNILFDKLETLSVTRSHIYVPIEEKNVREIVLRRLERPDYKGIYASVHPSRIYVHSVKDDKQIWKWHYRASPFAAFCGAPAVLPNSMDGTFTKLRERSIQSGEGIQVDRVVLFSIRESNIQELTLLADTIDFYADDLDFDHPDTWVFPKGLKRLSIICSEDVDNSVDYHRILHWLCDNKSLPYHQMQYISITLPRWGSYDLDEEWCIHDLHPMPNLKSLVVTGLARQRVQSQGGVKKPKRGSKRKNITERNTSEDIWLKFPSLEYVETTVYVEIDQKELDLSDMFSDRVSNLSLCINRKHDLNLRDLTPSALSICGFPKMLQSLQIFYIETVVRTSSHDVHNCKLWIIMPDYKDDIPLSDVSYKIPHTISLCTNTALTHKLLSTINIKVGNRSFDRRKSRFF